MLISSTITAMTMLMPCHEKQQQQNNDRWKVEGREKKQEVKKEEFQVKKRLGSLSYNKF